MGNILHGIKNGLDTFEFVRGNEEREKSTMEVVHSLANRSMKLARDVMKLTMIRDDPLEIESMPLERIIDKSLEMALEGFPDADPSIHRNYDRELMIRTEEIMVEAFYNLFHNAFKVQEGRKAVIGINAFRSSDGIMIDVWDHGGGMPEEMKDRIFDRYSNPVKKKHTGIGMTVVQMVVRRFGGIVEVEDRIEQGKVVGTNFKLTIPQSD
jgi:signal transduction histidine kinase